MDEWYSSRDGDQLGPMSFDALIASARAGRLRPDDFVWTRCYGKDWRRAHTLPTLFAPAEVLPQLPPLLAARADDRLTPAPAPRRASVRTTDIASARPRTGNFVARHWRGELPLCASALVFGTALGAAVGLGVYFAASGLRPIWIPTLFALLPLTIGFCIWQSIGIWRAATRAATERETRLWSMLAKAAVVLAAMVYAGGFLRFGAILHEILPREARAVPEPAAAQVSLDGTTLRIRGPLGQGSAVRVARIVGDRPVELVELESSSGITDEAIEIAQYIRQWRSRTYAPRNCNAACTFMFLAGRHRTLGFDGRLGFSGPGMSTYVLAEAVRAQYRTDLSQAGVPAPIIERILATAPDAVTTPEPRELLALGMVHEIRVDRSVIVAGLRRQRVFQALERTDRPRFDEMVDEIARAAQQGATLDDVAQRGLALFSRLTSQYIARADDAIVIEALEVAADRDSWLMERDPESCAAYQLPTGAARVRIPLHENAALLRRLEALSVRLIESAAQSQRPVPDADAMRPTLERLFAAVAQAPGANLELLEQQSVAPADYPVLCRTSLAIYAAIRGLPRAEQASLYRFLNAAAQ